MISKMTKKGYRFMEVPVHHYYRMSGKSEFFNFKRIFIVSKNLIKLWYKIIIKKDLLNRGCSLMSTSMQQSEYENI